MLSLIETLLSLLTALISACFPREKNDQEERPKKRRRYSITETTTHTTTIETSGSTPNLSKILDEKTK